MLDFTYTSRTEPSKDIIIGSLLKECTRAIPIPEQDLDTHQLLFLLIYLTLQQLLMKLSMALPHLLMMELIMDVELIVIVVVKEVVILAL